MPLVEAPHPDVVRDEDRRRHQGREARDGDVGEERGRPAEDQARDDQQHDPVQRHQEAIDLRLLRPLKEIADAVVSKRDPVERRERPERPLLDPQEEPAQRRVPVGRAGIDREQHAEVHVGVAADLLAVDVVCVVAGPPEPEAHPAKEGHPELAPEVVHPAPPRQREVPGVVADVAHGQEADRGDERQDEPERPRTAASEARGTRGRTSGSRATAFASRSGTA